MSDFDDSIFQSHDIAETQKILAEQLKPIKEIYFVQWQKLHPTSYSFWLKDLEGYAAKELCDLNDESNIYIPELIEEDSDLDLFWQNIASSINNKGLFPYLDNVPLYYFSTPIANVNQTPLQYIVSHIEDPKSKNIFVADLVRLFNLDPIEHIFDFNKWTLDLIIRLNNSNSIEITTQDKWMWIDRTISVFYSATTRQNTQVTTHWLAFVVHQFLGVAPQHQASVETALKIILKESYRLDEASVEYIGSLIREKWFDKKYIRRLETAIKTFYKASFGRSTIVKFIPKHPPHPSSSSSSSFFKQECPAWRHNNTKVYWKSSYCTCLDKTHCFLKQHTIFTLQNCDCSTKQFCILRAVQFELNRLNVEVEQNTVSI